MLVYERYSRSFAFLILEVEWVYKAVVNSAILRLYEKYPVGVCYYRYFALMVLEVKMVLSELCNNALLLLFDKCRCMSALFALFCVFDLRSISDFY
jgi:hypothetical protein